MSDIALANRSYNDTIKRADEFVKSKEYENSLSLYEKAHNIKPDMDYAIKMIDKIKEIIELKRKISEKSAAYSYNKAMQLALKTVLNATYGAFANKYFVLSNAKIANAITAMGRDLTRYMVICSEDYFYNKWHTDSEYHKLLGLEYIAKNKKDNKYYFLNKNYKSIDRPYPFFNNGAIGDILLSRNIGIDKLNEAKGEAGDFEILYEYKIFDLKDVKPLDLNPKWVKDEATGINFYGGDNPISMYCDTDSCAKDSVIITDSGDFTIEELYNRNVKNGSAGNTLKGHESVNCDEKVLNWDNKLYYAPVKRIIRHKVSKPKWLLKTKSGKKITVTDDHSMIVFRNGEKIEIKPHNILKTDRILKIIKK